MDEAGRRLMDGITRALNGVAFDDIPIECRSDLVRAVCELKSNYDELWKSFELMSQEPKGGATPAPAPKENATIAGLLRGIESADNQLLLLRQRLETLIVTMHHEGMNDGHR